MNNSLKQMFLLMKRMGMSVAVDTQAMLKSEYIYFSDKNLNYKKGNG